MSEKITVPEIIAMKKRNEKIACLTSYDHIMTGLLNDAGIDLILVGDSAGMSNPSSGEGIYFSLYAGKKVAECISLYLRGNISLSSISKLYQSACDKEFGTQHRMMAKFLRLPFNRSIGAFFDLAQQDSEIKEVLHDVIDGNINVRKLVSKVVFRRVVNVLKGRKTLPKD